MTAEHTVKPMFSFASPAATPSQIVPPAVKLEPGEIVEPAKPSVEHPPSDRMLRWRERQEMLARLDAVVDVEARNTLKSMCMRHYDQPDSEAKIERLQVRSRAAALMVSPSVDVSSTA
jgi:hypothetical protein